MSTVAPSVAGASTDGTLSGTIRWEFDKDSVSNDIYSTPIDVGGIPWRLNVCTKEVSGFVYLAIYFNRMEGEYTLYSAHADISFKLINHVDDALSIKNELFGVIFDRASNNIGNGKIIDWESAIDEGEGFIKDGKLTVQAELSLWSIQGFRARHGIDFTVSSSDRNVALVIDGEKIFIGKQVLAAYSPFFNSMFYGNFTEKNKQKIELKDVDRGEFIEMLNVIYPPSKNITDESFEYLLKLGDRFEIDMVMKQVEQFLITSTKLSVAAKLVFAGRYRLFALQYHCISNLKTTKEVTDLKKAKETKYFSEAINLALLDRIVKISY